MASGLVEKQLGENVEVVPRVWLDLTRMEPFVNPPDAREKSPMFPPEETLSQVANIRQRSTPDERR